MMWSNPRMLWILVAVVLAAVFLMRAAARRRHVASRFAQKHLLARLYRDHEPGRRVLLATVRVAAMSLVVIAVAGPRWGFRWEEVHRQGIDLLIAIDTSRSMLASDVKPNRLARAKLAILDLVKRLDGDRVGLVPFAGAAFLECPLTLDYAAFERALHSLDVGIIPRGGTSLARAIDVSLEAFDARQSKHQALLIITDGESHEGDVEEAAARANERGIKIYTVGIGTAEGELIPVQTNGTPSFMKDRSGNVVKTRLDEDTLKTIALATGGAYVRGLGPDLGLDQVFDEHIAQMEERQLSSSLEKRYEERFQIPLAAAAALLILELLIGEGRRAPVTQVEP